MSMELRTDNIEVREKVKQIFTEYQEAFNRLKNTHKNHEGQTYTKETNETPEQFADLIRTLTKFNGCTVELIGSWIWVSGNTKEYKDQLKELNFRWSKNKAAWYFHEGEYHRSGKKVYDLETIRSMYGATKYENEQKVLEA